MDAKEAKRIAKWMRKNGVLHIKTKNFELILEPSKTPPKKTNPKKTTEEDTEIPTTTDPNAVMPADSDMLFWSTDQFDNIQAGRKDS